MKKLHISFPSLKLHFVFSFFSLPFLILLLVFFIDIDLAIATVALPGSPGTGGGTGQCNSQATNTCTTCGTDLATLKGYLLNGVPQDKFCNANVNVKEDGGNQQVDVNDYIRIKSGMPLDCATSSGNPGPDIDPPRLLGVTARGAIRCNPTCYQMASCLYVAGAAHTCNNQPGFSIAAMAGGADDSVRITVYADDNCGSVHGNVQTVMGTIGGTVVYFTAESSTSFSYEATNSSFPMGPPYYSLDSLELVDNAGNSVIYTNDATQFNPNSDPLDNGAFTHSVPL